MKKQYTFNQYLSLTEELLAVNKTTGNNHSEEMIQYTKLNLTRMGRWLKTAEINIETIEIFKNIKEKQNWILITEAWCGDAAHSTPFIHLLSELSPNIDLKLVLRDENLTLMDQYLTNGGRSIPKLIVYDDKNNELFNWGPRPTGIQIEFLKMKKENLPYESISQNLQILYNQDKGKSIVNEITGLIKNHII